MPSTLYLAVNLRLKNYYIFLGHIPRAHKPPLNEVTPVGWD